MPLEGEDSPFLGQTDDFGLARCESCLRVGGARGCLELGEALALLGVLFANAVSGVTGFLVGRTCLVTCLVDCHLTLPIEAVDDVA